MVTRMVPRSVIAHVVLTSSLLICAGCNTAERTESLLTYTGEDATEKEILASISARLERVLKPRGFACESDFGHTYWYGYCRISDLSNPVQATQTFVKVMFPDDRGSVPLQIETGHVTLHPLTPSDKYFRRWAELVRATVCAFQDFDVEHRWPADSEYPISC